MLEDSKIAVAGLWHLGCVTASCLAQHYSVIGVDFDSVLVDQLNAGMPPIMEPGLTDLLQKGLVSGSLRFSVPSREVLARANVLWITWDTPVDEFDQPDSDYVLGRVRQLLPLLTDGTLVVVSSQMPVGTCKQLDAEAAQLGKKVTFACVPENLRLGQALASFNQAERMVAGVRSPESRVALQPILSCFTKNILWMRPESAEMTKHALNAFLAVEIAFANEVGRLCERFGASMIEVSQGLKSDVRVGQKAYLMAGSAYSGGTLARDVASLNYLAEQVGESTKLLSAIAASNEAHKQWYWLRLRDQLTDLAGRKIVIFGLTYKAQTDTLRRSAAMELAEQLSSAGAEVVGWDPVVKTMPEPWSGYIHLAKTPEEAVEGAEALVIATFWPEFRTLAWSKLLSSMKRPLVLDPGHTLADSLPSFNQMVYLCVGELRV